MPETPDSASTPAQPGVIFLTTREFFWITISVWLGGIFVLTLLPYLLAPRVGGALVPRPVVQPVGAVLPELEERGNEPVAAPPAGERDSLVGEALGGVGVEPVELVSVGDGP